MQGKFGTVDSPAAEIQARTLGVLYRAAPGERLDVDQILEIAWDLRRSDLPPRGYLAPGSPGLHFRTRFAKTYDGVIAALNAFYSQRWADREQVDGASGKWWITEAGRRIYQEERRKGTLPRAAEI